MSPEASREAFRGGRPMKSRLFNTKVMLANSYKIIHFSTKSTIQ